MRLEWSAPALGDLEGIYEHIFKDSESTAVKVIRRILRRCEDLRTFPQQGSQGRALDTRELVVAGLPYVVVYRVEDATINVLRVWHGAQQR